MDLNKLTQSERVIGGAAIALVLFSFFPWYGKGNYSRNGWSYLVFGIIPVLLAIIMAAQIAIARFSTTKLPDLPITWAQVHLIAGGLAAVLVLLRLLITDKYHLGSVLGTNFGSVSLDRQFGLFLSFLASIGLVVGAYLKNQEPASAAPPPA